MTEEAASINTETAEAAEADTQLMQRALELAKSARFTAPPNPAVGCVIADDTGRILGEGATAAVGGPHAEIAALHDLRARGFTAQGATAFVTLEPCCHHGRTPPCTDSLIATGIARVVVAVADPDPRVDGRGLQRLRDAGIRVDRASADVEAAATSINRAFFHRLRHGRPFIRIKLASSLDGRTAMQSGESVWITGEAARRDVQFMRAESDCILSGSGTIMHDDPSLNVRLSAEELALNGPDAIVRQPLRVLVDSQLRVPTSAKLFTTGGDVRIYTDGIKSFKNNGINKTVKVNCQIVHNMGVKGAGIDLGQLMQDLASLPVNHVHVEAGATLCGALLSAGLADEIVLYLAPHLMGNQGKPQFVLPEIHKMDQRLQLALKSIEQVGEDVRLTLEI